MLIVCKTIEIKKGVIMGAIKHKMIGLLLIIFVITGCASIEKAESLHRQGEKHLHRTRWCLCQLGDQRRAAGWTKCYCFVNDHRSRQGFLRRHAERVCSSSNQRNVYDLSWWKFSHLLRIGAKGFQK